MSLNADQLKNIIEAALMAAGQPLSIDRLLTLFLDENQPSRDELRQALQALQEECEGRGVELKEVSTGFRYQAKQDYAQWVARLWEEKPAKYSRALLETLALIAYRQPITRGEIEDIRGVSVSSNIMKTLQERDWVKVVGHRDVPGKPAMYATTKQFLDYFNLKSLSELPTLAEIRDIDSINAELDLAEPGAEGEEGAEEGAAENATEEIAFAEGESPAGERAADTSEEAEVEASLESEAQEAEQAPLEAEADAQAADDVLVEAGMESEAEAEVAEAEEEEPTAASSADPA